MSKPHLTAVTERPALGLASAQATTPPTTAPAVVPELPATPMAQTIKPQGQSAPVATAAPALAQGMTGITLPLTQAALVGEGSRATSQAPQSTRPAMLKAQARAMTETTPVVATAVARPAPAVATLDLAAATAVATLEVALGSAVASLASAVGQGMTGTTQAQAAVAL